MNLIPKLSHSRLFLLCLLLSMTKITGQIQNPYWAIPPNVVSMSTGYVSILSGTPLSKISNSGFGGANGLLTCSSEQFYMANNTLKGGSGNTISFGQFYAEVPLMRAPGANNQYYTIGYDIVTGNTSYQTRLIKFALETNSNSIQFSESNVLNVPCTETGGVSIAVAKPGISEQIFFTVSVYKDPIGIDFQQVYKHTIHTNGNVTSFLVKSIYLEGENSKLSELELSHNERFLAWSSSAGQSAKTNIYLLDLQSVNYSYSSLLVGSSSQPNQAFSIPGLEFNVDNSKLFYSLYNRGIYYAEINVNQLARSDYKIPETENYSMSQLELATDGLIYASNGNSLRGFNPSLATTILTSTIDNVINPVNSYGIFTLIDQIDGYDYSDLYGMQSCPASATLNSSNTSQGVVQASQVIETAGTFTIEPGTNLDLKAGNFVRIKNGVHLRAGSVVKILIAPCETNGPICSEPQFTVTTNADKPIEFGFLHDANKKSLMTSLNKTYRTINAGDEVKLTVNIKNLDPKNIELLKKKIQGSSPDLFYWEIKHEMRTKVENKGAEQVVRVNPILLNGSFDYSFTNTTDFSSASTFDNYAFHTISLLYRGVSVIEPIIIYIAPPEKKEFSYNFDEPYVEPTAYRSSFVYTSAPCNESNPNYNYSAVNYPTKWNIDDKGNRRAIGAPYSLGTTYDDPSAAWTDHWAHPELIDNQSLFTAFHSSSNPRLGSGCMEMKAPANSAMRELCSQNNPASHDASRNTRNDINIFPYNRIGQDYYYSISVRVTKEMKDYINATGNYIILYEFHQTGDRPIFNSPLQNSDHATLHLSYGKGMDFSSEPKLRINYGIKDYNAAYDIVVIDKDPVGEWFDFVFHVKWQQMNKERVTASALPSLEAYKSRFGYFEMWYAKQGENYTKATLTAKDAYQRTNPFKLMDNNTIAIGANIENLNPMYITLNNYRRNASSLFPNSPIGSSVFYDELRISSALETAMISDRTQNANARIYNAVTESTTEQVLAYPNPTSGKLHLNLEKLVDLLSIQVFSSQGNLVLTSTSSEMDLSGLSNGIYTVVMNMASKSVTTRVEVLK